MYAKHDQQGRLIAFSLEPGPGLEPWEQPDLGQLQTFILHSAQAATNADKKTSALSRQQALLQDTDIQFIRVLEDLIELLIQKGLIRFTDLPPEAQRKMLSRKHIRKSGSDLDLLHEDDGIPGL